MLRIERYITRMSGVTNRILKSILDKLNRKLNEDINNVVKLRMILDPLLSKVIKP